MHSPAEPISIDGMEVAPGYAVATWKALQGKPDDARRWRDEIAILDARIRKRFIDPVDGLIAHEVGLDRGTFGFAILAIDCLLVETFQGFREGIVDHNGQSGRLVRAFLSQRLGEHFDDGAEKAGKAGIFYDRCRCGIHHSGQTDGDFRVRRSGPLIEFETGSVIVNRTVFHEAIKREFDSYLEELAESGNHDLRKKFRRKMNAICGCSQ